MHNQRVTINELVRLIPTIGEKLTPIIQSEPGCGKTSLLSMLEDNMGDKYDYIYVDCPVKDMQDIAMTIPNHETRTLETYVGSLFKLDSPKPKVILLDEFMKAPKLLQVIFTRLMLERFVGDTPLPDGSIVFGTSNNQSDGVGDTMLAHASNRVCLLQMQKPQVEDWLVWASENAISPLIRAWVHMFPRALNSYLDDEQKDNPYIFQPSKPQLSFVTPRSLAKASVIVENRDILGELPTMSALSGTIGYSASADMSAFLSLEKSLPDINEILERPDTIKVPDEISAQLMVMFQALDHLKTQDQLTNFMKFIKRIKSSEIQAIFFTMLVRNKQTRILGRGNAEIAKWATENYELF
jgi:hypothetical protein|tara:strand:+ start:2186 stop:3247 length:1062 start_codon:yes stop_codon:yes gene_type:complete